MASYRDGFDNIVVPIDQADIMIQQAVNKGQRRIKMKKRVVMSISAILICAGILGSGFFSTSMAEVLGNLPFIGSIFEREKFAGHGLENVDGKHIAKFNDAQITDNGITVAIREVYYDKSGISMGYVVAGKGLSYNKMFRPSFYYNGRTISGGAGGNHEKISDEMYVYLIQFAPDDIASLPDSFELEVVLTDNMVNLKKSPYRFKIPVSRRGADEKTRELLVMKAVNAGETIILVKTIVFTPLATVVEYECSYPGGDEKRDDNYQVRLITSGGAALEPGFFGWQGINGERWIDKCRADFPAIADPKGSMALEITLPDGQRTRVTFEVD